MMTGGFHGYAGIVTLEVFLHRKFKFNFDVKSIGLFLFKLYIL